MDLLGIGSVGAGRDEALGGRLGGKLPEDPTSEYSPRSAAVGPPWAEGDCFSSFCPFSESSLSSFSFYYL